MIYYSLGVEFTKDSFEKQVVTISVIYILTVIFRLEPYVLQQIKKSLRIKTKKQHVHSTESLNSFLNSALNIEFVFLILASVKSVAYRQTDNAINKSFSRRSRVDSIELQNIDNWNVETRNSFQTSETKSRK
jgi:hypothetical protein